jgi:predicted TPR repeat methyltransferase
MTEAKPRPWLPWLLLAVLLPVAGWVLNESQRLFRADWASAAQRHQVLEWVSGAKAPASAAEWEAAHAALLASVAITPEDPDMHERLGDAHTVAGQRDWAQPALRQQHFANAQRAYEAAAALRPAEPQTWAMIAAARQAAGEPAAQVHEAWARALKLGPFEGHLQAILMQVVLADWEGASPGMRNWATTLFDDSNAAVRGDINRLAARYGLRFDP